LAVQAAASRGRRAIGKPAGNPRRDRSKWKRSRRRDDIAQTEAALVNEIGDTNAQRLSGYETTNEETYHQAD
jgi:hypothetical protein